MFTLIESYFFWIDLAIAFGVTAFAVVGCRGTDRRRWIGRCFWIGAALGLLLEVPVFFDGAESLLVGYTRDQSPSGVFVPTAAPIDMGMRCALAFPVPGREGKVHVIGRVMRTVPPELSADPVTRVPGMGVEFERFAGRTDRRAIESWIHRHEHESLRPETHPLSTP